MRQKLGQFLGVGVLVLLLVAGCTTANDTPSLIVTLTVDGQERSYPQPIASPSANFCARPAWNSARLTR